MTRDDMIEVAARAQYNHCCQGFRHCVYPDRDDVGAGIDALIAAGAIPDPETMVTVDQVAALRLACEALGSQAKEAMSRHANRDVVDSYDDAIDVLRKMIQNPDTITTDLRRRADTTTPEDCSPGES